MEAADWDARGAASAFYSDVICIGSAAGVLHALDIGTGKQLWHFKTNGKIRAAALATENAVYVASLDHFIYALDRKKGKEIWRFDTGSPVTTAPVLAGDNVIIGPRERATLYALDAKNGKPVWEVYYWLSWVESTPTLVDGLLYIGSSDSRRVRAIDPANGGVLWATQVWGWTWGTPLVVGDTVYFATGGTAKYFITQQASLGALDRKTGALKWRKPIPLPEGALFNGFVGVLDDFDLSRVTDVMACRVLEIDKRTITGRGRGFIMAARPATFSKSGSVENRGRSHGRNWWRRCVWRCASVAFWLIFGGGSFSLTAATLPAGFTESQWGSDMSGGPTAMAFAPDGRLFVCLQDGHLRVIDKNGVLLANSFVTLSVDSNGERGLLGVAFDPNFASNNYVYVYYTVPGSPAHNRISRFTANGDVAVANSEFVVVNLDNLSGATNHNGGAIHFGPDGKLYAGVGENANGANSQSLSNRLGKMLRINSDGTIPSDNPASFPGIGGSTSGANRAIWAVGLRNPFTFAFQAGTSRMFINDVGQSTWEEINDGIAGSNYGWPAAEGPASPPNPNFRDPIFYYGHGSSSTTGCAIVGGAFYNPSVLQFPSGFVGKYFFADLCTGWIRVLDPSSNTASDFASDISSPVDLHVGPDGALYYLTHGGQVFRIQATPSQGMNISTRARVETGDNVLIGGFIITGSAAKKVIIRAIGPSLLQHGLSDVLADPTLELHDGNGALLQSNDNWQDDPTQASQISASGLAPSSNLESAIIATLQPGNYTAIVRGKNSGQGIALAEVYDLDPAADSQLRNISGRSYVQTNDNVMIGGFIIGNNIGATTVIVRAIGPSLSRSGLSNVLADPTLELYDGNGTLLQSNDNWQDDPDQAARISAANLAPSNSLESAIWASLAPGNYTAIVRGKNNGVGIGLVEVYSFP